MMGRSADVRCVQIILPGYLKRLVGLPQTSFTVTVRSDTASVGEVLEILEGRYPMLRGVLRGPDAVRVKPHLRVFAGTRDLTLAGLQQILPEEVTSGRAPLRIVAAISGG